MLIPGISSLTGLVKKAGAFIGGTGNQTSTNVTWPSGTEEGDLAVLLGFGNTSISGSGLTRFDSVINHSPSLSRTGWKFLTSADISSYTVTVPNSGAYMILIFRDVISITRKQDQASITAANFTMTGITKVQNTAFILCSGIDRDVALPDYVNGWTAGANGLATFFGHAVSFIDGADYDEGTWSQDLHASSFGASCESFEILS